jgi:hypothetical protein
MTSPTDRVASLSVQYGTTYGPTASQHYAVLRARFTGSQQRARVEPTDLAAVCRWGALHWGGVQCGSRYQDGFIAALARPNVFS